MTKSTLLFFTLLVGPVHSVPWTAEGAARRAVLASHLVEEYQARQRGDQAALAEVEAGNRPTLNFASSYTHITPGNSFSVGPSLIQTTVPENYSLGLALRQLVSDFGKLESNRQAALLQREVTSLQTLDQQDRVAEAAMVEFQQAALAEELLQVSEQAYLARQAAHLQAQQQYRAGVVSRYDVLRSETALSEAQQQRVDSLREKQQSRLRLFSRLGIPPKNEETLVLDASLTPPPAPVALPNGPDNPRRDLQAAWQAVAQAESQVQVAERLNQPRLELQSDYAFRNQTATQTAQYWAVGLALSAPLYDGGVRAAKVSQAQALVQRLQANYAEQLRLARVEADGYWEDLQALWQDVESSQVAVVSAREGARVSRVRYRNGLNTNVELLDAESSLASSEGRLRRARRNYQIALIRWSRSTGRSHAPEENQDAPTH